MYTHENKTLHGKLTEKGRQAFILKDYLSAGNHFVLALTYGFGVDSALGNVFSKLHQGKVEYAAFDLENYEEEYNRFDFKKLANLLLGYCYTCKGLPQWIELYFDRYTQMSLLNVEEEDEKLHAISGKDEYDMFEAYFADSYKKDENAEREYLAVMLFYKNYIFELPAIPNSYLNYLAHNPKWLDGEESSRQKIANNLLEWNRILWEYFLDTKRFPIPDTQWKDLGYICSDLIVKYWPDLSADVEQNKVKFEVMQRRLH